MENNDFIELVCGICGGKMCVEDEFLKCLNGWICVSADYLKNFFDEKYKDKITRIEVTNKNSAKIYFGK